MTPDALLRPPADDPANEQDGVLIAQKPGPEFASVGKARIIAPGLAGVLPLAIVGAAFLLHAALVHFAGVPRVLAAAVGVLAGVAALVPATAHASRLKRSPVWASFHARAPAHGHRRVRVVVPPSRQTDRLGRWAVAAAGLGEEHVPGAEDLAPVRGGFEPVIVRPWLGVRRERAYWCVAAGVGLLLTAGLVGLGLARGTLLTQLSTLHIWGYGGLIIAAALGAAEFCFPVYLRLAPGRLDEFRYRFLGRAPARVTTHDLRSAGLCVHFGSAMIAVEPPRPPGVPPPPLVLSKKWPHFQEHAPGHTPAYFCVALCPQRTEFCQRVVQAARATEPTPPLGDEL